VITSVNRDELPDGGSAHWAATVRAVRAALPRAQVEVLTPDFLGDTSAVARVLEAGPHVYNHNMETVKRLYRTVRPQASYLQSLEVLRFAKHYRPDVLTKSGAMVGLGETAEEIHELLRDLRAEAACDIATLGQYLQPSRRNMQVREYVTPAQFDAYRDYGLTLGYKAVFAGPFVRSSYMADLVADEAHHG
jgi:lipoyl synthase